MLFAFHLVTLFLFISSPGESIPICALIENCSSRLVVPKAVMFQIQTYTAKGKTKSIKQVVASSRGNVVPPDTSSRCNGNSLKIPPVSPSILNSDIMRVEYLLAVSKHFMMIIWLISFLLSIMPQGSLGIEPTTFALLTQCSNHWATGTLTNVVIF